MISDPSITESALRLRHFKEANRQLYEKILKDPEFAKKFTQEEIDFIERNVKAGTGKPPRGYTWHHSEITGQLQLVPREQHEYAHHIGGVSLDNRPVTEVLYKTMARWTKIALADWVLSVGYSTVKNTLDINELKRTTTGVAGAWMSAILLKQP
jgi:formamidopyrimidine-DNA glycosylase